MAKSPHLKDFTGQIGATSSDIYQNGVCISSFRIWLRISLLMSNNGVTALEPYIPFKFCIQLADIIAFISNKHT